MDVVRVTVDTEESVRSCGPRRLDARCASEAGGGGSAVKIALCRKTAAAIDAAARGCGAQEGTTHWQMGARGMQRRGLVFVLDALREAPAEKLNCQSWLPDARG